MRTKIKKVRFECRWCKPKQERESIFQIFGITHFLMAEIVQISFFGFELIITYETPRQIPF